MNLQEHADAREREWLEKRGVHEYERHDLPQEILEELADAENYRRNDPVLKDDRLLFASLWGIYERVRRAMTMATEEEKDADTPSS